MLEVLWDFKGLVVIITAMIYERVFIFEHQAQFRDRALVRLEALKIFVFVF